MFTDIINKEAFEFTCKTESTASRVRHHIESHTMMQLNHIIETVFSEASRAAMPLKIDKIEIDLGDIYAAEMGNDEVLSRFRNIFRQKINDVRITYNSNLTGSINAQDVFNAPMQNQNELELIQSLIETGDVPWWVDKNNRLNIDSIVQSLVNNNSKVFRRILEEYKASPELFSRLLAQIKPGTSSKLKEFLPDFSDIFLKERYIDENTGLELNTLSVEYIKNLKNFFKAHTYSSYENSKYRLTDNLVQLFRLSLKNKISFEGSKLELLLRMFGMEQMTFAAKNYPTSKQPIKKDKIAASVNNLTVFEVELLLLETSRYLKEESLHFSTKITSAIDNSPFPEQDNYQRENISYKEKSSKEPSVGSDAEIAGEIISNTTSRNKISDSTSFERASSIEKNNAKIPENNLNEDNDINEQNTGSLNKIHEANDLGSNAKQPSDADKIENRISFSDEEEASGQNYKLNKMIGFIMKRLKTLNPFLFQYLQRLDKNQLEHLSAIFKKRA